MFLIFHGGCCWYGSRFLVFTQYSEIGFVRTFRNKHVTRVFIVAGFGSGEWLTFHVVRSHFTIAGDCSYDMIWYMIWYLFTAIGFSPGGSGRQNSTQIENK